MSLDDARFTTKPLTEFVHFVHDLYESADLVVRVDLNACPDLTAAVSSAARLSESSADPLAFSLRVKDAIVQNLVHNRKLGLIDVYWLCALARDLPRLNYRRLPDRAVLTLLLHATKVGIEQIRIIFSKSFMID